VLVTSLSFLGITLNQALAGVFQKHLRMDRVVIAEVIGRIFLLAATFLVIRADCGLLWVMGSVVIGSVVNFLMTFFFSRRFVKIKLVFEFGVWKNIIKETWPIALSIAFNLVYFKIDTVILSLYHSEEAVGIYGAAYKVLEVLTTLPAMFAGLVLPLLTAAWAAADHERFKRVLRRGFDAMAMVALPLVVGTLFVAGPVMELVAPGFDDSAALLKVLIFATATIFIGNLFGNTVVAIGRQLTMMWVYLGVAVISLVGYLVFIPRYSYFGAAGMTVVSELLVTLAALLIVSLATRAWPSPVVFMKSAAACVIMAIVLYGAAGTNLFMQIALGGVTYVVTLLMLRGVSARDLREIVRSGE